MLTTLVSLAALLPMPFLGLAPNGLPAVSLATMPCVLSSFKADEEEDDSYLDLYGWDEVTLVVEEVPDLLEGAITKSDLVSWLSTPLRQAGIEVVEDFDRSIERFATRLKDGTEAWQKLMAWDRAYSWLQVSLLPVKTPDGYLVVSVDLYAFRSGILHPFRVSPVVVWQCGQVLVAEGRFSSRSKIRDAIRDMMEQLVAECRKAAKVRPTDERLFVKLPNTSQNSKARDGKDDGFRF
ncbi:MAG: ribbon-helix-helix domain-containing protein [Fimbriimonadales bacterium]